MVNEGYVLNKQAFFWYYQGQVRTEVAPTTQNYVFGQKINVGNVLYHERDDRGFILNANIFARDYQRK